MTFSYAGLDGTGLAGLRKKYQYFYLKPAQPVPSKPAYQMVIYTY